MVDEVQVENRDPQAITTRHYTVKAPFTREARAYEVGEAIALEAGEAQPLIEQGLLVNPDGDLPPEDPVAPASEPPSTLRQAQGSGQAVTEEAPATKPAEEEPPAKESRRRKPADSE